MLKYLETYLTGAKESSHTITEVHYFYETSTSIMYMQCAYPHNLSLREPAKPIVKLDGSFLTYQDWLAFQDEEQKHCKCKPITQAMQNLELQS